MTTRSEVVLNADPSRVLARLFVPGHEQRTDTESRATGVLARIVALPEDSVRAALQHVRTEYGGRHRDLAAILTAHYEQIAHRLPDTEPFSAERKALIGAVFTQEYAIEGAALFNPSVVVHPDQGGLGPGRVRFVLSLRAVGEGHISSIEFRTGVWGPGATLILDEPGPHVEQGVVSAVSYDRDLFKARLAEEGADTESARYLIGRLSAEFEIDHLETALRKLRGQRVTRHGGPVTEEIARRLAESSYRVVFSEDSALPERVLWPQGPTESQGLEDARFVRFVDADGAVRYLATYTAFDGDHIAPQQISTTDFREFVITEFAGPAAKNKGMALFPRKVGARYFALSRWDREGCSIASSKDGRRWGDGQDIYLPDQPWELIQTGNCGSPLETDAGWLVLTHGVGPMREYAIGALMLDLEDPTSVVGRLREPLLRPAGDERNGYVPNVVYSCGGLIHDGALLLPYGVSDASVRFAFFDLAELLARLTADGPPATIPANSSA
ncbi:glycoside hydrolase family 130 protein [Sporichthya sp.]|uniref:glycoside hydrolase family 130 protein n=1 Tax=Sporichthya sp. TaxID=65475 RepID=UPI0025E783C5|nr:glycoside hydrolase family 130 protein [Sporichthya sp.]